VKTNPLVIVFTGNAQNAILTSEVIWKGFGKNMHVATMNYRSYGHSEGSPTEGNLFADALAFTQHMKDTYKSAEVYLLGISLGTGVAGYVASKEAVDGLILMTPYDSIANVGKGQYPFLPVNYLIQHKFETTKHIKILQAPVAIIRAGNDRVILNKRTDNLIKYITNLVHDVTVPNMEHTGILEPANRKTLKETLQKALISIQKAKKSAL
jgi:pimeloyl-ACP methyl ester carboxylesterase